MSRVAKDQVVVFSSHQEVEMQGSEVSTRFERCCHALRDAGTSAKDSGVDLHLSD